MFSAVSLYFQRLQFAFVLVCLALSLLVCLKVTKQVICQEEAKDVSSTVYVKKDYEKLQLFLSYLATKLTSWFNSAGPITRLADWDESFAHGTDFRDLSQEVRVADPAILGLWFFGVWQLLFWLAFGCNMALFSEIMCWKCRGLFAISLFFCFFVFVFALWFLKLLH